MTTENVHYIEVEDAFVLHVELMQIWNEKRCGIDQRELLESALARPKHAVIYGNADIFAQAATLIYGLIKNHPWLGGNKRTAAYITDTFLQLNGYAAIYSPKEGYEIVLAIDLDNVALDEIEEWYRSKSKKI